MSENCLLGKRIVITRAPEQSRALADQLKQLGAQVIVLPFVEFRLPDDCRLLDLELERIAEFDWIVFTSQNGSRFLCHRLRELGRDLTSLPFPRPQIAALGTKTANSAAAQGLTVDLVTHDARSGAEFVSQFAPNARGKKILLPQSDQAVPDIAEKLRANGAEVTAVVAYRTCVPESLDSEELDRIQRDGADAFVFASPSAFRNFEHVMGKEEVRRLGTHAAFVAIGPTTARAILAAGLPIVIEAAKPNTQEIVDALIEYFSAPERARASS